MGPQARVGGRGGLGRPADGPLVDDDDASDRVEARGVAHDLPAQRLAVAVSGEDPGEDVEDEARLPGTGDPGDRGEDAQWKRGVDVAQVVTVDAIEPQPGASGQAPKKRTRKKRVVRRRSGPS